MGKRSRRTAMLLCGFAAAAFTFAGKYIMIPYGAKSPLGIHKALNTMEGIRSLTEGLAPEIVGQEGGKELETAFRENREGEFVFSFSIDEFIDRYNGFYRADRGKTYLAPSLEWRTYNYGRAIHSDFDCCYYNFSKDETILPFPTVSVYTPSGSDYVHEIMLNFDDHSYTDALYKAYGELCFYTLKALLPDLADDEITALYTALNDLAYEHLTTVNYTPESVPYAVYCRGNVALYPYFAIGESMHLCIIPAAQQYLAKMEQGGAEIIWF